MSDAVAPRSHAANGHLDNQSSLPGSLSANLVGGFDAFDARESLAARLAKLAGVVALHAALIALALTIQPRLLDELLPKPLNVRTIVEEVKPPEPRKPEVIPPKPLPQARQVARPPQPAPPVMTGASNADSAPATFAVTPQPAPVPLAPPAPPAPVAAPAPAQVTAARFDADYLKNPPPAYPSLSRRLREEGRVLLLVRVSAQGAADSVQLRQSSGFSRLDEAAIEAVRQWRFIPAKRGDEAIAASVIVPIVFRIE